MATSAAERSPDGRTPAEQLSAIRRDLLPILDRATKCWSDDLLPKLAESGVRILRYDELKKKQRKLLRKHFKERIFPVLTPLAFDPGHPFPHISNLSINPRRRREGHEPAREVRACAPRSRYRGSSACRTREGRQLRRARRRDDHDGAELRLARGGHLREPRSAISEDGCRRVVSLPGHARRRRRDRRGRGGDLLNPGVAARGAPPVRPRGAARESTARCRIASATS